MLKPIMACVHYKAVPQPRQTTRMQSVQGPINRFSWLEGGSLQAPAAWPLLSEPNLPGWRLFPWNVAVSAVPHCLSSKVLCPSSEILRNDSSCSYLNILGQDNLQDESGLLSQLGLGWFTQYKNFLCAPFQPSLYNTKQENVLFLDFLLAVWTSQNLPAAEVIAHIVARVFITVSFHFFFLNVYCWHSSFHSFCWPLQLSCDRFEIFSEGNYLQLSR